MNMPWLRVTFCAFAALVMATIGFGEPPTPNQALEYAKSVVLVKRVVQENQVHQYVIEVWRFDANAGTPPPVGSEDRNPMPYDPRNQHPERDGIVFTFGQDRPKGLPNGWIIPVMENGMVPPFEMDVNDVRTAVMKAKPKA
jgi:hypothetical protein